MPRYQPQFPHLIDPTGVKASPYPRPMAVSSDKEALERDFSEPYEINPSVEKAWLKIYENQNPDNELYRLGEALIMLADNMSQYRWRHFVSVQRLIGLKPGTGGSAGVGWLKHVTEHRFFPELWSIRTEF